MAADPLLESIALAALSAGRAVRAAVHAMPPAQRGAAAPAALKPGGQIVLAVDGVAERVGLAHLERLADAIGCRIAVITDAERGTTLPLGRATRPEIIYAMLDAVDGTIKVGGLGNAADGSAVRLANDGGWGVAFACTAPTAAPLEMLTLAAFVVAVVVDGNPPRVPVYPHEVVTLPEDGALVSRDCSDRPAVRAALRRAPRVYTSTQTTLSQAIVYLDGFQAFDRRSAAVGDEALVVDLYRRFLNRHAGGAFDVWRQYGNLSALLRLLFGWRQHRPWVESQGGGFVVVNENLANLVPAVPLVVGAGGCAVDFAGAPLAARRLVDGRTSVVYAANEVLLQALVSHVQAACD